MEFDVVVIGAGHNGLIVGSYLAKEGLSVAIIERRYEAGGGLACEQLTTPGFIHNTHSYYHMLMDYMPAYKELELENYGATYVCPPVQTGLITHDHVALTLHLNDKATYNSISRFSTHDAETFRKLKDAYLEFEETIVMPALYTAPAFPSERTAVFEKSKEGLEFLSLDRASPLDVVSEFFESEAIKSIILNELIYPRWVMPDYYGLGSLTLLPITMVEKKKLCVGGSHELAHALWRYLHANKGVVLGCRTVSEIIVEEGEAKGVRLTTGEEIRAKKAVVSAVDVKQTFLEFLEEHVDKELRRKIENFKLDEFSLFTIHLALKEKPNFLASRFDRAINEAFHIMINVESVKSILNAISNIRDGKLPKNPIMYCSVPTLYDETQAPPGKHTMVIVSPVPYELREGAKKWDEIKEEYMDTCLEELFYYAPNIRDKIIGKAAYSPLDIERRFKNMLKGGAFMGRPTLNQIEYFRPCPELSHYRTPIKRLYLASSSCHPGGGITGGPGYIAAQVIIEDMKSGKL